MPLYCKYEEGSCQLNENDPLIKALDEIISTSEKDDENSSLELKETLQENCTPLNADLCASGNKATFCQWNSDDVSKPCKAVSKTSMGLDEDDDADLSKVEEYCNAFQAKEICENRVCGTTQILSETGQCVDRPWYDYIDCATEIVQGACPHGADPNENINKYCIYTCSADFVLGNEFKTTDIVPKVADIVPKVE